VHRLLPLYLVLLVALALLLGACGGAPPTPTGPSAAELEALLPENVAEVGLTRSSREVTRDRDQVQDPGLGNFLDQIGLTSGRMVTAEAVGFSDETGRVVSVAAWQVGGVGGESMLAAVRSRLELSDPNTAFVAGEMDGRQGFRMQSAGEELSGFAYERDDIAFVAVASDFELLSQTLAQLP
jgi:hypothetical protein